MDSLIKGIVAGLLATVPMTLFMRVAHRELPLTQKYPLPPEQITTKAARSVGLKARPQDAGWEWKTYAGHFSYGAAVGAIYSLMVSKRPTKIAESVGRGSVYGIAVWAVSYLGWLPAAGILRPATREPASRNGVMIIAHVIWGSVLALLAGTEWKSRRARPQQRLPTRKGGQISVK